MRGQLKTGLTALVVALLLTQAGAAALMHSVNFDASAAQNPSIDTDVTKDYHEIGWGLADYEDDQGDLSELDAVVNSSVDNPVELTASDIEAADFGAFPRKGDETNNSASALDASEWSTDASGTAGSLSVSDVTTAPGVDAVELSTSSQTSSDVATFTYSNFSITSDAEKRYIQVVEDVDTLDSGAEAAMMLYDADGDYVAVDLANASADEDTDSVVANATGEGDVLQVQVGSLTVQGSGDGTIQEIQNVTVDISEADATIQIAALNAEKMGEWTFGDEMYDESGDGDKDSTRQVTDPHGAFSITDTASMGATFDDSAVHGLTVPMHFEADQLSEDMDIGINYTEADNYPSFDWKVDQYYRLQLPSAYDLSYADAQLEDEVSMPASRYQAVDISEGVGDTDFENVSSWTSVLSNYDTEGADRVLDDTIQPGQQIAFHAELVVTGDERAALDDTGGAAGQFSQDSGGPLDFIFSLPGMVIGGLLGFLGLRKMGG